jgi:hypothetical protein
VLFTSGSRHSGLPRGSTDPLARRGARLGEDGRQSRGAALSSGIWRWGHGIQRTRDDWHRDLCDQRITVKRDGRVNVADVSSAAAFGCGRCGCSPLGRPLCQGGLRQFRGLSSPGSRAFTTGSLAFTTGSLALTTGSPPRTGPPPAFTTGSPLGRFSPAEGPQTGSGLPKWGQLRPRFVEPKTGRLRAPQEKCGVVSPRPKRRSVHRLRPKFVRGQLWLRKVGSAQT